MLLKDIACARKITRLNIELFWDSCVTEKSKFHEAYLKGRARFYLSMLAHNITETKRGKASKVAEAALGMPLSSGKSN